MSPINGRFDRFSLLKVSSGGAKSPPEAPPPPSAPT